MHSGGIRGEVGVALGCGVSDTWSLPAREASYELSGHSPRVCGTVSCKPLAKRTL